MLRSRRNSLTGAYAIQKDDEIYEKGQEVYFHGPRGSDLNPYKIHKCLGDGQYKLERNGKVEPNIYKQANLQTHP